ncbi:MAG TPA: transcriptional repressor [Anaerolineae bacterium]|nr:transcriptional repressor [Anaerolineae bacterium]HIP70412.1 transcriptional repressor [Anaerolineae bacterium]
MCETQTDQLEGVLADKGYRLTKARRAILQALVTCGGHVSADDLADIVRQDAPFVGRMTVYRTLDLLSELGLIRPVYQGTGAAHYILLTNGHHHHMVCTVCSAVIEFDECVVEEMARLVGRRFDFQVEGHLLEFYGRCSNCR